MIKYSKFTDNTGSGNFTDIFVKIPTNLKKVVGGVTPPTLPAPHALGCHGYSLPGSKSI